MKRIVKHIPVENKLSVGVVKEHRNILSELIEIRRTHKLFYIDDKESQEVIVHIFHEILMETYFHHLPEILLWTLLVNVCEECICFSPKKKRVDI